MDSEAAMTAAVMAAQAGQGPGVRDEVRWSRQSRDQEVRAEVRWSGVVEAHAVTGLGRATVTLHPGDVRPVAQLDASVRMGMEWRTSQLVLGVADQEVLLQAAQQPERWSGLFTRVDAWKRWCALGARLRRPAYAVARELARRLVLAEDLARFAASVSGGAEAIVAAAQPISNLGAERGLAFAGPPVAWPEGLLALRDALAETAPVVLDLDRGLVAVHTLERLYDTVRGLRELVRRLVALDAAVADAAVGPTQRIAIRAELRGWSETVAAVFRRSRKVLALVREGSVGVAFVGPLLAETARRDVLDVIGRREVVLEWCVEEVRALVAGLATSPSCEEATAGEIVAYAELVDAIACWVTHRAELVEAYQAARLSPDLWNLSPSADAAPRALDIDQAHVLGVMGTFLGEPVRRRQIQAA
jgi:hypothetical protein